MTRPLEPYGDPVADEYDVVAIFRARLDELNVARLELDQRAGLTPGYSSKRLCLPPLKYFGRRSFWNVAAQLGLAVQFVVDEAATRRFSDVMAKRHPGRVNKTHRTKALVMSGRIPWLFTSETGRKVAEQAMASIPRELRIERAKRAAKARWAKGRRQASCSPGMMDAAPDPLPAGRS